MDPVDSESPFLGARGDMKRMVGSPRGDRGEVSSDRQFERLVDAASRSSCGVDGEENGWSARSSWSGRARRANLEPVGFWAQGGGRGQLEELLLDALHYLVQLRNVLVVRVVQRLKSHNQHTGGS